MQSSYVSTTHKTRTSWVDSTASSPEAVTVAPNYRDTAAGVGATGSAAA